MFTPHLIHVKPWRAEGLEKEPPASALLCPNHPAAWQHVLNYTAAAAWQNKLYLKKYSLKRGVLLHRSLRLFLFFWENHTAQLKLLLLSPAVCLFRVHRPKSLFTQEPQHVNHLNQGMAVPGVAHKRAGPAGVRWGHGCVLEWLALLSISSPAALLLRAQSCCRLWDT